MFQGHLPADPFSRDSSVPERRRNSREHDIRLRYYAGNARPDPHGDPGQGNPDAFRFSFPDTGHRPGIPEVPAAAL
ncbi:hypothetical protein D3C83_72030 [compost metagenome]